MRLGQDISRIRMGRRPLIAVTTSEVRVAADVHRTRHGEPPRQEMALGSAYLNAVEEAGGLPVVVTPLQAAAIGPLLDQVDGLVLSGGPDIAPAAYGAEPHPELGPTEPHIDLFELALARAASHRGVPILALCRGAQILNVAHGGTLEQHLPDRRSDVEHRQRAPWTKPTHTVRLEPGSRVAEMAGAEHVEVNSFHHQAVSELGSGLRAVGFAPDGVIEAIEAPHREFLIGVQWHAEGLTARREHRALFDGLVESCRGSAAAARAA